MCCFIVDSVEDADKWLRGLELLREETLQACTPEIIERYAYMRVFILNCQFIKLQFTFLVVVFYQVISNEHITKKRPP